MKCKAIEKIAPVQPTKKGEYITTVQQMDNVLILNVYKKGKLRGRHAINPATGEYCQYRAEEKDWKYWKYGALLDINTYMYLWNGEKEKKRTVFDTPEQEQLVREALQLAKEVSWPQNTFDLIDNAEKAWQREKKEKTEYNRRMRIQDKMHMVPAPPEDIKEWIWKQEGEKDFVFWDKKNEQWRCTACGKSYLEKYLKRTDGSKKIRHNDMVICPRCKKHVMAKKRTQQIEQKTHFALLQKMDQRMSVCRSFDVAIKWDLTGSKVQVNEAIRIVMYHTSTLPKYCAELFFNQYSTKGAFGKGGWDREYAYFDNKSNPAGRRVYEGFLYPAGIEEALEDTAYTA